MSNLLILGGSGFVGLSLQDELLKSNYENIVCVSSRINPPTKRNGHSGENSYVSWDIRFRSELAPNFDVIIHAATPASAQLNTSDPGEMYKIIVQGMENVIEFASRHISPPKILFTSSGAVYDNGPITLENVREDTLVTTNSSDHSSAYSDGKRKAEVMLKDATKSGICSGVIARLFAFSGVHLPRDRHFAIGNFVHSAVTQKRITVRSDGSSIRSYLDQQDMAQWLLAIADKGIPNNNYHVGSERAISIRDLAFLVAERYSILTEELIPVEILGQTSPLDGVSRYVPSTYQTRKELGLSETISLEDSIDAMLQGAIASQL